MRRDEIVKRPVYTVSRLYRSQVTQLSTPRELLSELAKDPEAQRLVQEREEARAFYRMELEAAEERGKSEGKAEGMAEAVVEILKVRGIAITEDERAAILGCHDSDKLQRWLAAAVTAGSAQELLMQ